MAEEDSAQEKTEEPTPKRQQKARDEGQIPRSKDLTTFAVLIASALGLMIFGSAMAQSLMRILVHNFSLTRDRLFDQNTMFSHLGLAFDDFFWASLPFFSVVVFAAIVGPTALGGILFSGKSLLPKFNRMDPIAGIKRMFSVRSLVELVKGIAKVSLVIAVAFLLLYLTKAELMGLARETLNEAVQHALDLCLWAGIALASSTIVIAMIDVPFQLWEHKKKLRMSRQDIKDELKDSEGKPEVKSKIRQMQMQMAQNRMMSAVPEADVVITNPTHFAVALKYKPESMSAPVLVAKGVDQIALTIRSMAKEHKIEQVESPSLARAIFHTTELEQEVPAGLYVAVAQVLAYVFQLREFRRGRGDKPSYPQVPDLPADMRY
ncbi:flagellar biosynthesis protein FlhB [Agaribacterium haliotis]|uniref:flagellar biosynthesis protein FlhB n=1 Tax=Agaribacterium haliotis TaxID=2013869 RepID=UPI000BB56B9A|nr:flagellar biosynthesis protein FlhB [Agaribacterium haliotis]